MLEPPKNVTNAINHYLPWFMSTIFKNKTMTAEQRVLKNSRLFHFASFKKSGNKTERNDWEHLNYRSNVYKRSKHQ